MLSRIVDRKVVFVSQIEIALEIALNEQDLRRVAKYHHAWHRLQDVPHGQADGCHGSE